MNFHASSDRSMNSVYSPGSTRVPAKLSGTSVTSRVVWLAPARQTGAPSFSASAQSGGPNRSRPRLIGRP